MGNWESDNRIEIIKVFALPIIMFIVAFGIIASVVHIFDVHKKIQKGTLEPRDNFLFSILHKMKVYKVRKK